MRMEGPSGIILNPNDDFDDIDWDVDYVVEVYDKETGRLVYRIRLDEPERIMTPRLEDSYGM